MDARVPPVRSRWTARGRGAPRPEASAIRARHLANFGPLLLICALAFALADERVAGASGPVRVAYGTLVALNVLTIAMSCWSAMLGAAVRLASRFGLAARGPILRPPSGEASTAVLIAIHEEDAAKTFAMARAIADDVLAEGLGGLDIFVLSDSRSAGAIAAEATMLAAASRDAGPRLFYRRRTDNAGRKAGNVADFVRRWGASYEFMVVLDADSLMTGACIARLVGAMEANPSAGLIQAMAYPVGRCSLFARLQQFDSRLLGPLFQAGVAFWQGPRGNYWGHNAIIRVSAFAESCGLPLLPGKPPLGGEILSHDTVEAALLLRAGYDVWMLPSGPDGRPDGSWEETPTNLLDHLERDKRWLRGNLQHVFVLAASGLKAASYYHLVRGLGHFLYAPLMVVWVASYAALDRKIAPDALTALVLVLVLAPRLLGLSAALVDRRHVAAVGGRGRLAAGGILDLLFVALLFPVATVSHLVDVAGLVLGGETRWDAQARGERGLTWTQAARRLGPPLGGALVALVSLISIAPLAVAIFAPGLLCGIPLAVVTSRRAGSRWLETPEDARRHPLRDAAERIEANLRGHGCPPGVAARLPEDRGLAMPTQCL